MRIDTFCRKLRRSYPHIGAVHEQIEELRELLLIRKEEILSSPEPTIIQFSSIQGSSAERCAGTQKDMPPVLQKSEPAVHTDETRWTEERAEEAAIQSLGDVRELFDVILQKNVYNSRMEFCASVISTVIIIMAVVPLCAILYALYGQENWFDSFLLSGLVGTTVGIMVPFMLFLSECIQTPHKISVVSYNARTLQAALIGWITTAVICIFINHVTEGDKFPWAVFPIIGVADWPLTSVIYNRLFFTHFFEAKER